MSWANSVLPTFMAGSGQSPEDCPKGFPVQIDTTPHRSETASVMAFSDSPFNLTGQLSQYSAIG
jgi:hypothetical protein